MAVLWATVAVTLGDVAEWINEAPRRDAGLDPDDASVRDAKTVEGYLG